MALGARPYEVCGRVVETLQRGGSLCQRPAREDADGTVKDVDGKALSENKYYSDLLHYSGRGRLAPAEKEGNLLYSARPRRPRPCKRLQRHLT